MRCPHCFKGWMNPEVYTSKIDGMKKTRFVCSHCKSFYTKLPPGTPPSKEVIKALKREIKHKVE